MTEQHNHQRPAPPTQVYIEEPVIFHRFLTRFVPYPTNQCLWGETCSFGLYTVTRDFLTTREFAMWHTYRRGAQQRLGERFLEDPEMKEKGFERPHTEETIRRVRRHYGIPD